MFLKNSELEKLKTEFSNNFEEFIIYLDEDISFTSFTVLSFTLLSFTLLSFTLLYLH